MTNKTHWENVYQTKSSDTVSWFQQEASTSLSFLARSGKGNSAAVIDVGGGASTFVDGLLDLNYQQISVLDLSAAALAQSQKRLGELASKVKWIEADVLNADLPVHAYDVWHDRAVFHFLTKPEQRTRYIEQMHKSLKPNAVVIMATFAEDGPEKCSGLPVKRYSPEQLQAELGNHFKLQFSEHNTHITPAGAEQKFQYSCFLYTA